MALTLHSLPSLAMLVLRRMKPGLEPLALREMTTDAIFETDPMRQRIVTLGIRMEEMTDDKIQVVADVLVKHIREHKFIAVCGSINPAFPPAWSVHYYTVYDPDTHCALTLVEESGHYTLGMLGLLP